MTDARIRDVSARTLTSTFRNRNGGAKKLEIADNPDGPWTAVHGDASEETVTSADEILADNDLRQRIFFIPRQYDGPGGNVGNVVFPPAKEDGAEALFTGYQIRFAGQKAQYSVQSYKSDAFGALFEFTAVSFRTNMYGLVQ